jgi:2-C-methyl-D-erythritol 4-phosphate cytidylyltransferase
VKAVAIIVAGGAGRRFGQNKQVVNLDGKMLIELCIEKFEAAKHISKIILVVSAESRGTIEAMLKSREFQKIDQVVDGSDHNRFYSVKNGFNALTSMDDDDLVVIHDGARPLISTDKINTCVKLDKDAIVLALPVTDTLKQVNKSNEITQTVDRDRLVQVQTPQAFRYKLLREAYEQVIMDSFTDEAGLISAYGTTVSIIEGEARNIKITTPQDLAFAEFLLAN